MGISWAKFAEELVAMPMPALVPPGRIATTSVDLAFDDRGRILLVGGSLPAYVVGGLPAGMAIERVSSLGDALERMDAKLYKLVVISPSIRDESDGVRFVRAFKATVAIEGVAVHVRQKYAKVPFLILPLEGDTQFAVFRTASDWFLFDTLRVPLLHEVLRCFRGSRGNR